jgi:hypothetical protein
VLRGRHVAYFTDNTTLDCQLGGGKVIRVCLWEDCPLGEHALLLTCDDNTKNGRIFQLLADSEADCLFWLQHFTRAIHAEETHAVKGQLAKMSSGRRTSSGEHLADLVGGRPGEAFGKMQQQRRRTEEERTRTEAEKGAEEHRRHVEEEKARKEAERKALEDRKERYKAILVAGIQVKKHHLRKNGVAERVVWVDKDLTWLYVAIKQTKTNDNIRKRILVQDIRSVAVFEDSLVIAEVITCEGPILKLEFTSTDSRDQFIQFFNDPPKGNTLESVSLI